MTRIEDKLKKHQLDLKTTIVLNKAMRTLRPYEMLACRSHGLTLTQFSVLETLYSKGTLRIQDLIDKMIATSGNMTVVIKNMERDGYISRSCDPNDRRSFLVSLTEAGKEKIEQTLPDHIEHIVQAMQVLTEEDKQDLIRILKKFKQL